MVRSLSYALVVATALLATGPAAAHPHVWIDAQAALRVADGRLAAVEMTWTFDLMFSALLIHDFDLDADGRFDAEEQQSLHDQAFRAVADYGYFTHVTRDGATVTPPAAEGFTARIADDRVVYRFRLPLPEPVLADAARVGFYDPEWYVEVAVAAGDVEVNGGSDCRVDLARDADNQIQVVPDPNVDFGALNFQLAAAAPWTASIACPAS